MNWLHSVKFPPYGTTELEAEALRRCAHARELEEVESFTAAREALGAFYAADDSFLKQLSEASRAEVWLRTGSLLRRVGGRDKADDELERAKIYLLKALEGFGRLGNKGKAAETLIAMAACYWGLGINIKSRQLLNDPVFAALDDPTTKANRLYMLALVARSEQAYPEAVHLFREIVADNEGAAKPALMCKYRGALGNALLLLGEKEKNPAHTNEALLNYALSSRDAEEAGNTRYAGFILNNVGYIFFKHGRFEEAYEHLQRARRIFEKLLDVSCIAQVDETTAQALNAEGRYSEAVPLLRRSIQTFEISGQTPQQAEALLTLCASLSGLGQLDEAEQCAARSTEIYALHELTAGEGHAHLALAELLTVRDAPPLSRLLRSFVRATRLLASEKDAKVVERLDRVEKKVLELSGQAPGRVSPPIELVRQSAVGGMLWDEGLTYVEAMARVEEWYLARLILEHGTLEAIARELDLSIEGVRQKIAKYPHLDLLRKAMRGSNLVPLGARRPTRKLIKVRLDKDDHHLCALGPCGGDTLGVESCENLNPGELGVVEVEGVVLAGYLESAGEMPTLNSGHADYPPLPCPQDGTRVLGRVVGYWQRGKSGQKMKPIKVT